MQSVKKVTKGGIRKRHVGVGRTILLCLDAWRHKYKTHIWHLHIKIWPNMLTYAGNFSWSFIAQKDSTYTAKQKSKRDINICIFMGPCHFQHTTYFSGVRSTSEDLNEEIMPLSHDVTKCKYWGENVLSLLSIYCSYQFKLLLGLD